MFSTKSFTKFITSKVAPFKSVFLILSTISEAFCLASSFVGAFSPIVFLYSFSFSSILAEAPGITLSKYFLVKFVPFFICSLKKFVVFLAGSLCTTSFVFSFAKPKASLTLSLTPFSLTEDTACVNPSLTALAPFLTTSVAFDIIPGLSITSCLPSVVKSVRCCGVKPFEDLFTALPSFFNLPNLTVAKFSISSL